MQPQFLGRQVAGCRLRCSCRVLPGVALRLQPEIYGKIFLSSRRIHLGIGIRSRLYPWLTLNILHITTLGIRRHLSVSTM